MRPYKKDERVITKRLPLPGHFIKSNEHDKDSKFYPYKGDNKDQKSYPISKCQNRFWKRAVRA